MPVEVMVGKIVITKPLEGICHAGQIRASVELYDESFSGSGLLVFDIHQHGELEELVDRIRAYIEDVAGE